jgi:hypothetical protein
LGRSGTISAGSGSDEAKTETAKTNKEGKVFCIILIILRTSIKDTIFCKMS